MINRWIALISITVCFSCSPDLPKDIQAKLDQLPAQLDFNTHVKPILSDKCFACHGPDKATQKASLRLDLAEGAYAELPETPGKYAIVPGQLNQSEVFHRIVTDDPHYVMPTPKSNLSLNSREKAILIKWIDQGAEYKDHWAFIPPVLPSLSDTENEHPSQNPIDRFVQDRLSLEGLQPLPEADKETLLRRLFLDLTGLPPSVEDTDRFLADNSSDAYEKQVDRLLDSPHYGEKMATDWMDLARYADTHGYTVDRYRDMSPWRDWVIEAFNSNMSYDQFLTWQLAGDLLPNPSREQILATGFNRLHPQNMEGGIVDEEFRVEYVSDRTSVLGQGLMAMTLACARCHDHKYDPISQKNFFELSSFFNNINETGQISWDPEDMPVPTLMLTTDEQEDILAFIDQKLSTQKDQLNKIKKAEEDHIAKWVQSGQFHTLKPTPVSSLAAHFTLDHNLHNQVGKETGKMDRKFSKGEKANFIKGKQGQGLQLDGDAWLDLKPIGIYSRSDRFSIGMWLQLPTDLKEGVIFHKNLGSRLHGFKGYQLYLKDDQLQLMLARTWPDNAIIRTTNKDIPRDKWFHVMMTYDGSSQADGLKLYMDGKLQNTDIVKDNLYKDILYSDSKAEISKNPAEPGLKIGARWRGQGIKNALVDDIVIYNDDITALEVLQLADKDSAKILLAKKAQELTDTEYQLLSEYYLQHHSKIYQEHRKQLKYYYTSQADSMEQVQEVMVMKEMNEPRQTYLLERGQYDAHGEMVYPNTPESILPMADSLPKNRLGLAQWLTHPEHPLTARVAVNRYWQNYFGQGIVRTTEDFGNQGSQPSHPQLLDWLAVTFVESGWDIKALQKTIVMSATYRQQSIASPELLEQDPTNILLARGPKTRLSSEMMRDNALKACGILNEKIGGESVYPYQPEGLWSMNSATYPQDTGDKLYRRSLYTIWKRTVPHPTLSTFDQPDRNECTVRRQKTNTPLQALVLLNDPTYIEAARIMAVKIAAFDDLETGLIWAYRSLTGRVPKAEELALLTTLRKEEYQIMQSDKEKTKGWLETGEYKIDPTLDPALIAANAVTASVIINSDATLTKR
ncbi:Planctomycete cytochrome C [Reichenbachiella agariperforans]|uniref:Planctomycete cytochrome C n=1 Tax=Reichenbachiella agariperforans TaxID=156994 RepID=A0A1M6UGA8_REIAG|nr:DUF1553 domain-containing protein [Reichenbachiella agariperforans]SHK68216.1 Planctomycete cytochrome C [Reichenbachiella agariperforans]